MPLNKQDFPPLPSQKPKAIRSGGGQFSCKSKLSRKPGVSASINDLPDELVLQILDYLPGIDYDNFQLPALVNLSLTNRRLHAMVNEKLYAAFDSNFCVPFLFLRTLMANPGAASMVRSAKITYKHKGKLSDYTLPEFEGPNYTTIRDRKAIKEGFRALNIPHWKSWAQDCNSEYMKMDAQCTAVLMHTPNLASLEVEDGLLAVFGGPKWVDLIKRATSGHPVGGVHQFTQLRSIWINLLQTRLEGIAPLFRLQSLRKLTIRGLAEVNTGPSGDNTASSLRRLIPKSSNNLEELYLQLSFIHIDIMDLLLGSAKALTHFQYEHSLDNVNEDATAVDISDNQLFTSSSGNALGATLLRHKSSLRSLQLHHSTYYGRNSFRYCDPIRDSLSGFAALERLECPIDFLIDTYSVVSGTFVEYLPASLRELRLTLEWISESPTYYASLQHMASHHQPILPFLKSVHVCVFPSKELHKYDWGLLQRHFAEVDVCFSFDDGYDDSDGFSEDWPGREGSSEVSESSDEVDLYSSGEENP